jgi:general secretion pathway protein G
MQAKLLMRPFLPRFFKLKATGLNGNLRRAWFDGFTIIELMIIVAIISTLAAIAIPSYISSRNKAKIAMAISEIKLIEKAIINYCTENGKLPDSLSDIKMDRMRDPWGRPYQYLRIDGGTTPGLNGKRRRDKNANPVNSDFDLYSMGKDGKTVAQFTGKKARDDIVRANNGSFLGLAEKH